jgi:hypothetical protein
MNYCDIPPILSNKYILTIYRNITNFLINNNILTLEVIHLNSKS